ncbi:hypothetical protein KFL_000080350 [Klebsormidium nitens]|uniref:EamA domain-containing protein n=1 Tax=Klebsormidium nitens TaxID=105231 RepID=A0A1Y1HMA5_KLENI|nr:hypothetical protein KFL_000080350 [Klebsormidium nitens]|eukprot:GAQ78131.1 hypothetical protein KFL_000080350 [Klebsormidium nitens]
MSTLLAVDQVGLKSLDILPASKNPLSSGMHTGELHGVKSHPDLGDLHHFSAPSGELGRLLKPVLWIWGGSKHSGVACMALSSLAYSVMGLAVKLLAGAKIPSSETVLVRCAIIALLSGYGLQKQKHPLLGSPGVRHLVLARAIIGFFALSAFFYSIQALPLRDATVLNFTMPVMTAMMAAVFLGEAWGSREVAGTICSLVGVLLVTQPDILFGKPKLLQGANERKGSEETLGVFMAIGGSALGAASYIVLRVVGKTGEPPLVCVFAFAAFSAPMAAVGMLFQPFAVPSAWEWFELVVVGLSAFAAQVLLNRGLQLEKASKATAIQYVKILVTYLFGVIFLHEVPSFLGVVGACLIAASAAFVTLGAGH